MTFFIIERCCSLCSKIPKKDDVGIEALSISTVRKANTGLLCIPLFREEMEEILAQWKQKEHYSLFCDVNVLPDNLIDDLIMDVEYIADANDLLHNCDVCDEDLAEDILCCIAEHT